jgi:hypothetical protein
MSSPSASAKMRLRIDAAAGQPATPTPIHERCLRNLLFRGQHVVGRSSLDPIAEAGSVLELVARRTRWRVGRASAFSVTMSLAGNVGSDRSNVASRSPGAADQSGVVPRQPEYPKFAEVLRSSHWTWAMLRCANWLRGQRSCGRRGRASS